MLDDEVILVDRKQVTAPNKAAAKARLEDEYSRDKPLTFTPDKAPSADFTQGTITGHATWEDAQNAGRPEPLTYDFKFKYVTDTWVITYIHSKP